MKNNTVYSGAVILNLLVVSNDYGLTFCSSLYSKEENSSILRIHRSYELNITLQETLLRNAYCLEMLNHNRKIKNMIDFNWVIRIRTTFDNNVRKILQFANLFNRSTN